MKQKAFTLVELVITIAIVGIIAITLGSMIIGGTTGCGSDWKKAEVAAKEFAQNIPNTTGKVSCTKQDTDNDGYCNCSLFLKDGPPMSVECGCQKLCIFTCADGCKVVDTVKFRGKGRRSEW